MIIDEFLYLKGWVWIGRQRRWWKVFQRDENMFRFKRLYKVLETDLYIRKLKLSISGQGQNFPQFIFHFEEFGWCRDKMIWVAIEKDYPRSRNKMSEEELNLRKLSQFDCWNNQDDFLNWDGCKKDGQIRNPKFSR